MTEGPCWPVREVGFCTEHESGTDRLSSGMACLHFVSALRAMRKRRDSWQEHVGEELEEVPDWLSVEVREMVAT